jgi:predicted DNA-binding transcriptional regulator AlpA
MTGTRLLSRPELLKMVGISYPTIWRMMRLGRFPLPRRIGPWENSPVRWDSNEVQAWIDALPRQEYTLQHKKAL